MSILDDIPGAKEKILDFACKNLPQGQYVNADVHKFERICRQVIISEPLIPAENKLEILARFDQMLEADGL